MHGSYTRRKIKALSERGRKMAKARWQRDRERRDAEAPAILHELAEAEAINLPRKQGDPVGILQWTDLRTGTVKRWTLLIGDRADRLVMRSPDGRATRSHGWTWILDHLRGHLAGRKI
jgi:hypothetical protein